MGNQVLLLPRLIPFMARLRLSSDLLGVRLNKVLSKVSKVRSRGHHPYLIRYGECGSSNVHPVSVSKYESVCIEYKNPDIRNKGRGCCRHVRGSPFLPYRHSQDAPAVRAGIRPRRRFQRDIQGRGQRGTWECPWRSVHPSVNFPEINFPQQPPSSSQHTTRSNTRFRYQSISRL